MATTIHDLPEELLAAVAEYVRGDHVAICNFRLVSNRFRAIGESVLYRDIFFRHASTITRISKFLRAAPRRVAAVHHINARCQWDSPDVQDAADFNALPELLRTTKNIRDLTIESPNLNHEPLPLHHIFWVSLMEQLGTIFWDACQGAATANGSLNHLRQLTLHWSGNGRRYWRCHRDLSAIFALPLLETLTVSCAIISDDAVRSVAHLPKTALRRLYMIECNITQRGLAGVLSRPRALEHLHIGETKWHDLNPFCYCKYTLFELLETLQQQRHSLKTLVITPRHVWMGDDPFAVSTLGAFSDGLSTFAKLHAITIGGRSYGLEEMLAIPGLVPPNLDTIHIEGDMSISSHSGHGFVDLATFIDVLKVVDSRMIRWCQAITSIESLRNLHITFEENSHHFLAVQVLQRRILVQRIADDLKTTDVALTVYARRHHGRLIPPYLYGETEPLLTPIYDSQHGGWTGADSDDLTAEEDNMTRCTDDVEIEARRFLGSGYTVDLDNPAPALSTSNEGIAYHYWGSHFNRVQSNSNLLY